MALRVGGVVAVVAVHTRPREEGITTGVAGGDGGRVATQMAAAEHTGESYKSACASTSSEGSDRANTTAVAAANATAPAPAPVHVPGIGGGSVLRRTPRYVGAVVGRAADVDSVWRLLRETAQVRARPLSQ